MNKVRGDGGSFSVGEDRIFMYKCPSVFPAFSGCECPLPSALAVVEIRNTDNTEDDNEKDLGQFFSRPNLSRQNWLIFISPPVVFDPSSRISS